MCSSTKICGKFRVSYFSLVLMMSIFIIYEIYLEYITITFFSVTICKLRVHSGGGGGAIANGGGG